MSINSRVLLICSLAISAILVIAVYFNYRPFSWPGGTEALGCIISLSILLGSMLLLSTFRNHTIIKNANKNISLGLAIGILWTIEIGTNNLLHPKLPLRDIIDDLFWAVIALFILIFASVEAYKRQKIVAGIFSGFWTGTSSGALACLTALVVIVFGMHFILSDPLNIQEWSDTSKNLHYPNMQVFFAYQTFAGAILHLIILGTVMGLILGVVGGLIGKGTSLLVSKMRQQ